MPIKFSFRGGEGVFWVSWEGPGVKDIFMGAGSFDAVFLLGIGSFLLTAEFFLLLSVVFGSFFVYNLSVFCLQLSFFAYSRKVCLRSTSTDCKQRSSTVSKKAYPIFLTRFREQLLPACLAVVGQTCTKHPQRYTTASMCS